VEAPDLKTRVMDDLKSYLKDNMQAWILQSDGLYKRAAGGGRSSAQQRLLKLYDERVALVDA
jgi:polyphosphate kinase